MQDHIQKLKDLNACRDGLAFAATCKDMQEVWDTCPRGDWLLWLLGKKATEADRKNLVLIACECARLALPYTKDSRVLACIETAEKWTRGEATIEQVREARRNADAASDAAYAAASDAAYAAYASDAAAYAAAAAAAYDADADAAAAYAYDAASASDDAYDAAADDDADARKETRKQCANIVRKYYPLAPTL